MVDVDQVWSMGIGIEVMEMVLLDVVWLTGNVDGVVLSGVEELWFMGTVVERVLIDVEELRLMESVEYVALLDV